MTLLVRALQKALFAERAPFLFGQERNVRGRQIARSGYFDERVGESSADWVSQRAGRREKARPGHRRKWNGDLEFRIIVTAGALKSLGPAMVEDVFASGVALSAARPRTPKHPGHGFGYQ